VITTSTPGVNVWNLFQVRKYNVELLANPIDRRAHWVKIAAEYNKACGTNLSHASLSKKLANIKQRDRQKLLAEKKRSMVSASSKFLIFFLAIPNSSSNHTNIVNCS
jgi:expansin (peptidoglycan-binding protein)